MHRLQTVLFCLALFAATLVRGQFQFSENNGTLTLTGYAGPEVNLSIPSTNMDGELVTSIGNYAFQSSGVAGITIPESITNIGDGAFLFCGSLTNVNIEGQGLASIGFGSFINCTALKSINLPNSLTTISNSVFVGSGLINVTLPGNMTNAGSSLFANCQSLAQATLSPGLPGVGVAWFQNCRALTNAHIPSGATSIGSSAFFGCTNLTNLTLPASLAAIGINAFFNCSNMAGFYFQGDAPVVPTNAFMSASGPLPATCFYLPGTGGWQPALGGLPTQLWAPQMCPQDWLTDVESNEFAFYLAGATNLTVIVQTCTNLLDDPWQPLQTVVLSNGTAFFSDPAWTNSPYRFYRLSSP